MLVAVVWDIVFEFQSGGKIFTPELFGSSGFIRREWTSLSNLFETTEFWFKIWSMKIGVYLINSNPAQAVQFHILLVRVPKAQSIFLVEAQAVLRVLWAANLSKSLLDYQSWTFLGFVPPGALERPERAHMAAQ